MAEPIALLDVNVLIALIDPQHVHHERSHLWFQAQGAQDGLTGIGNKNISSGSDMELLAA